MRLAATRSSIAAPRAARSVGDCAQEDVQAGVSDQTLSAASAANAGLLSAAPARRMAVRIIVSVSAGRVDPGRALLASITDRSGGSYFLPAGRVSANQRLEATSP